MQLAFNETVQISQRRFVCQIGLHAQANVGHAISLGKDPGVTAGRHLPPDVILNPGWFYVNSYQQILSARHGIFRRQRRLQPGPLAYLRLDPVGGDNHAGHHLPPATWPLQDQPTHNVSLAQQAHRCRFDPHLCASANRLLGQGAVKDAAFQHVTPPPFGLQRLAVIPAAHGELRARHLGADPARVRHDKGCQQIVTHPFGAAHRRTDLLPFLDQQHAQACPGRCSRCRGAGWSSTHHHHVVTDSRRRDSHSGGRCRTGSNGSHRAGRDAKPAVNARFVYGQMRLLQRDGSHRADAHTPAAVATAHVVYRNQIQTPKKPNYAQTNQGHENPIVPAAPLTCLFNRKMTARPYPSPIMRSLMY